MKTKKSILLNIPNCVANEIDQLARILRKSRTEFILESINRNIVFSKRVEVPRAREVRDLAYR